MLRITSRSVALFSFGTASTTAGDQPALQCPQSRKNLEQVTPVKIYPPFRQDSLGKETKTHRIVRGCKTPVSLELSHYLFTKKSPFGAHWPRFPERNTEDWMSPIALSVKIQ